MGPIRHLIQLDPSNNTSSTRPNGLILLFLSALSFLYGGAHRLRGVIYQHGWRPTHRLSCPVVSIGNLVAGGTGKTPMAQYIARHYQCLGYRPVIISRGYKGHAERKGGVVSDGTTLLMSPEMAGDEPFMLASCLNGIPVIVGRDRYRSGCLAINRFNPDLILLDDGFQHIRLARDLNILLLDGRRPLGNGHLLPQGILREPPSAIQRADAVVLTRSEAGQVIADDVYHYAGPKPVFQATHRPVIDGVLPAGQHPSHADTIQSIASQKLEARRVFAFSAIARNDDFLRSVDHLKGEVVGQKAFFDHYQYTGRDLFAIGQEAKHAGADCLVTTAKDFVRIGSQSVFPLDLVVVSVAIEFIHSDFDGFLSAALARLIQNRDRGTGSS